jgi:hypothetical protein
MDNEKYISKVGFSADKLKIIKHLPPHSNRVYKLDK